MLPLAKVWMHFSGSSEREIAMSGQHVNQPGDRDRVGRIIAREQRVAARIARHFDDTESPLARELRDILAHMPEPVEDDPNAAWHIAPQKGAVDW